MVRFTDSGSELEWSSDSSLAAGPDRLSTIFFFINSNAGMVLRERTVASTKVFSEGRHLQAIY